jgi:predicted MFS family arabinose efflux permease
MRNQQQTAPSPALVFMLALSCGVIVANIYYAQPLVGMIAPSLGMPGRVASLVVTLTQLGYAAGLLVLVPLGDVVENRRLLVVTVLAGIVPLVVLGTARSTGVFLVASCVVGLTSVAVQMVVPLAANLAPDSSRGRVVGNVMSGLLFGILLARPFASLIADALGWRAVFLISAGVMVVLAGAMRVVLPERRPAPARYFAVLGSLFLLPVKMPVLWRRAMYQSAAFGCFSLFWTAVPLLLAEKFGFSQFGIAVFALVGAAGAVMAPVAGRLADRDFGQVGTVVALAAVALSFVLAAWGGLAGHSVVVLGVACVVLDCGVQANLVFSQRAIYGLAPDMRSRLNGVFMAIFFVGGAVGSALVSPVLARFGWVGICGVGFAAPVVALGYFAVAERGAGLAMSAARQR